MGHVVVRHRRAQGADHVVLAAQGVEGPRPISAVERDEGVVAGGHGGEIRGHGPMLPVAGDGVPRAARRRASPVLGAMARLTAAHARSR